MSTIDLSCHSTYGVQVVEIILVLVCVAMTTCSIATYFKPLLLCVGVRYNAEKTQVGKYYSTPIFQFRMKCHLCDNHFEIRTDPKVHMAYISSNDYVCEQ